MVTKKNRELDKHSITDEISNKLIIELNLIMDFILQFRLHVLQRKYHLSPNLGWDNFHPNKMSLFQVTPLIDWPCTATFNHTSKVFILLGQRFAQSKYNIDIFPNFGE